jgi:hypothetical protein
MRLSTRLKATWLTSVIVVVTLGGAAGCSSSEVEGIGTGGRPSSGGSSGSGGAITGGTGGVGAGGIASGGTGVGGIGTGGIASGGTGGIGAGGASTGGIGGGGTCDPTCGEARNCCDAQCVNLANDPRHCGVCDRPCSTDTYCTGGDCVPPPCTTTCESGSCCGAECCDVGELCCDAQGPLDTGPHCAAPSDQGTCPQGCAPLCICASPDTLIATPSGERPIASLRIGDWVYSVDGAAVKAVPLVFVHRTEVTRHHVQRVKLASGATLEISAGHPTADGRTFGDLRAGDALDQTRVVAVDSIEYTHPYTYDILPDSDSGTYFAGGALIGSTLQGARPGEVDSRCLGAP